MTMAQYGWGIVDKNGQPTTRFLSLNNATLLPYALSMAEREMPDGAPFRIVKLFYEQSD